jgi:hypothetical protein
MILELSFTYSPNKKTDKYAPDVWRQKEAFRQEVGLRRPFVLILYAVRRKSGELYLDSRAIGEHLTTHTLAHF